MPTEKEKWELKKQWIEFFNSLTPEDLERERREAQGFGPKLIATLKEWVFKFLGFIIAPFGWALMWGLEKIADVFEPEVIEWARPTLEKILEIPNLPQEQRDLIEKALTGRSAVHFAAILPYLIALLIGFAIGSTAPASRIGGYFVDQYLHSARLSYFEGLPALFRDPTLEPLIRSDLADLGYTEDRISALILSLRTLPTAIEIRDLLLRGEISEIEANTRLEKLGYSADDITAVKKLFPIIPPLADMVRFADFGAFDPDIIERWREFYDAPGFITEPMSKIGIIGEWANRYWFSHWRQPGRFELGELFRRKLIDEGVVKSAYLTQGFSSFWQDSLFQLVKEVPTRVDVRRFWDMRTIDEERLREIYQAQGYFDKDLEDYILWTKVYVAWPDLISRYIKGWINLDDVRTELIGLGMSEERVDEMIETKVKKGAETPPDGDESRDFTKSEILDGYRRRMFSEEETRALLVDLNYGPEQIDFFIDREDLKREQTYSNAFVTRYKTLYVEGVMPWPDVADALAIIGLTEAEIAELGPLWEAEKLWKVARPTRANLDKFLKADIIDEVTYRDEMRGFGYSDRYIDWFLLAAASGEEEA